jgi:hypothetical protein
MHVEERRGDKAWLVLAGVTVLAIVLRFWRLGDWSIESDEVFMLNGSLDPSLGNPRPLLYFLNHYVVAPLTPLDELGLRLLPALFGVLAIPAFYFVSRHLVGTRAALFGTLLLTVSPLHVIFSQFGRYWTLVFLFSAVYPYALYIGIRERSHGAIVLGVVTGVLATLAHPVTVLLLGGPALWLMVTYLRPKYLRPLWKRRGFRWGALVAVMLAGVVALRFVSILQRWISEHDTKGAYGQYLLGPKLAPGLKQLKYLLAYAEGMTIPLTLAGVVGIYLLWRRRDRILAVFLFALALFPIIFLTLVSLRTPVSTYYLLPTTPVFFLGAGVFLDHLLEVNWQLRPRWLIPATVLALIVHAGMPTLVSQYRNGRRYDFRAAAQWLQKGLTPDDVVFSDQPVALGYYLPRVEVQRLRFNVTPLSESVSRIQQTPADDVLWIVAPAPAHAFRADLREGGLARWMYDNCQLRNHVGAGRLDFRQQYLQIYRCPPGQSEGR